MIDHLVLKKFKCHTVKVKYHRFSIYGEMIDWGGFAEGATASKYVTSVQFLSSAGR